MADNNIIIVCAILSIALLISINDKTISTGFARFCIAPDSYLGKLTSHLIELGKLRILTDMNKTEVANGQKLILNLTNNICKPGETFNLFGNQSTTPKTNLTSTGNVTASQIQNNTGSTANVGRTINIPVEINQFAQGWSVSNVMLYLNGTDGHYHLKGMLTNTLPETRSGFESILASFEDKATNSTIDSESGSINIVMDPNTSVPFDIKTMYTAEKANQFPFMKVSITP